MPFDHSSGETSIEQIGFAQIYRLNIMWLMRRGRQRWRKTCFGIDQPHCNKSLFRVSCEASHLVMFQNSHLLPFFHTFSRTFLSFANSPQHTGKMQDFYACERKRTESTSKQMVLIPPNCPFNPIIIQE